MSTISYTKIWGSYKGYLTCLSNTCSYRQIRYKNAINNGYTYSTRLTSGQSLNYTTIYDINSTINDWTELYSTSSSVNSTYSYIYTILNRTAYTSFGAYSTGSVIDYTDYVGRTGQHLQSTWTTLRTISGNWSGQLTIALYSISGTYKTSKRVTYDATDKNTSVANRTYFTTNYKAE